MRRFLIISFGLCLILYKGDAQGSDRSELLYIGSASEETVSLIRRLDIEIISSVRNNLYLITTKTERNLLQERGIEFSEVMQSDDELTLYKRAMYGESMKLSSVYRTYEDMLETIDELIRRYPRRIARETIGLTQQGKRQIVAVKISNDIRSSSGRPVILFTGSIHARELVPAEICFELINRLVNGYGTDARITDWLDRYEIYIVPVINVDGHYIVTNNIDPRWRKNARDATDDWVDVRYPAGIDLNRNYDFNFALGGSGEPESDRYRGPHPFSESETRAVGSLIERIRPVLSINYHSQGEVIFYPWVWRGMNAPDDKLLTEIASGIAETINKMDGSGSYDIAYGAGLVGQSYPWLYGRYGTFDFIVETGLGAHIFPPDEVHDIVEANIPGAYYLLERAKGPGFNVSVTEAETGSPMEAVVWFPAIESEEVDRRTTNPRTGRYYRLLKPGTYYMIVQKEGYRTVVVPEAVVREGEWTPLTITMHPGE